MAVFDSLQKSLDKFIGPIAMKLSNNKGIQAISGGVMATMPITLGVAAIAIFINLPIAPLTEFLNNSGMFLVGNQVMQVTMSMLAIYIVACIGYRFGESLGLKGLTSAVFSMGVFLVLMPLQMVTVDEAVSTYISPSYLGSNGIFVAIVLGLLVPWILSLLMKHVAFKLPDSVPPMVNDSLSPTFAAIIIFTATFLIKWGFTFTPWGNVFDMISALVSAPIMNVGSSVWAPVVVNVLAMTLWFFGIHPSAVSNIYNPVAMACTVANVNAFIAGDPLPYLQWQIINGIMNTGFCAEGLPLACALLTSKSERYKATSRLALVPAIFNITEPMMFGVPIVLNPYFAIPMILVKPIVGIVGILLLQIGLVSTLNPAVSMTWIMPYPVTALLMGGIGFAVIALIGFAISFLLFLPFVRTADKAAAEEEETIAAEASQN